MLHACTQVKVDGGSAHFMMTGARGKNENPTFVFMKLN